MWNSTVSTYASGVAAPGGGENGNGVKPALREFHMITSRWGTVDWIQPGEEQISFCGEKENAEDMTGLAFSECNLVEASAENKVSLDTDLDVSSPAAPHATWSPKIPGPNRHTTLSQDC
ncbi:hypothetical protein M8818_007376 [Zalaria obscura]|uniref:Uncharacterized protein n=1 Tax=Zalaria obscura TaxID=2024903 RepID=A0ACC3S3C5_9PEZI